MAYSLIKLATQELIITDAYCCADLIKYIQNTTDGQTISNLPINDLNKMILCLDPVKIVTTYNSGYYETSMSWYMAYSEDFIVPIYEHQIVCITKPVSYILDAYTKYILEQKCKSELKKMFSDRMNEKDIEDIIYKYINIDNKNSIEQ